MIESKVVDGFHYAKFNSKWFMLVCGVWREVGNYRKIKKSIYEQYS